VTCTSKYVNYLTLKNGAGIRGIPRQFAEAFFCTRSTRELSSDYILTPAKAALSDVPLGSSGSKALLIKIVLMIKALIISFSTGRNVFQIRQFRV
jgi:hypothetical protein